jgi:hypothetical protein
MQSVETEIIAAYLISIKFIIVIKIYPSLIFMEIYKCLIMSLLTILLFRINIAYILLLLEK